MGRINTGGVAKRTGDNVALSSSVSGTTLKLSPPKGYYDGVTGTVNITDADFVASKILSGTNLFGINGSAYNWSPNPIWTSSIGFSAAMIEQTSNISESSLYRTAGGFLTDSATFSGVYNGFFYNSYNNSTTCLFPWYSGSYGVGNSGLYLYSTTTGEEILIQSPSPYTATQTTIRSISLIRTSPTVVYVQCQTLQNGASSESGNTSRNQTVSSNFFNSTVKFRMRIGTCYTPFSGHVFQASVGLNGAISTF